MADDGFFLGHVIDAEGDKSDQRLTYDPKDLTTHGLVFGMTGSGKTGLCIGLLEEAGRAQIPIIAIDPKGDLTNLALCWPSLEDQRFEDWTDPTSADPLARAALWRKGLDGAGLDEPIRRAYRESTRVDVYTPGSSAGLPVSLLDRFDPPPGYNSMASEERSELIEGMVSAVLGLVEIDADPLKSREAILLASLIDHAWDRGMGIDLPELIQAIPDPPLSKLGVFEIDDFFPSRARRDLAMKLNALIASPSFERWRQGDPVDIDRLLSREGPSRTSVFYIAHLDDSERMSFVTLLLERVIAWMRGQSGSSELRALIYMDEVFGYLPPHPSNPPSKRPVLTLLKQARAFGVGTLLATQNPVDVDYKAITNAGTWLIGKLQTEQDKERILDGLMSASAGQRGGKPVKRSDVSRRISALQSRQFLISNAHDDGEELPVFKTRFVMSYLRGPLTRNEVTRLKQADFYNIGRAAGQAEERPAPEPPPAVSAPPPAAPRGAPRRHRHTVPATVPQVRAPVTDAPLIPALHLAESGLSDPGVVAVLGEARLPGGRGGVTYRAALLGRARLVWKIEGGVTIETPTTRVIHPLPFLPSGLRWETPEARVPNRYLLAQGEPGARYEPLPGWMDAPDEIEALGQAFFEALVDQPPPEVPVCKPLRVYGQPGERLEAFKAHLREDQRAAVAETTREDLALRATLESSWAAKLAGQEELLRMSQRELVFAKQAGDDKAMIRARDMAKIRLQDYKAARSARDSAIGEIDRAVADRELAALQAVEKSELASLRLDAAASGDLWFGILWIPDRR